MSSSPRRRASLSTQLVAWLLVLLALALAGFSAATLSVTRADLMHRFDDTVREASRRSGALAIERGHGPGDAPQTIGVLTVVVIDGQVDPVRSIYRLSDGSQESITDDDIEALRAAGLLSPTTALQPGPAGHSAVDTAPLTTVELARGDYRLTSHSIAGTSSAVVVTGAPLAGVEHTLHRLLLTLTLGSLATLAVAGIVVLALVKRTLRPLAQVSHVAQEVAALPLSSTSALEQRVEANLSQPGTEVGDVGFALNSLLDNVAAAFAARDSSERALREFVADASHELRTPLAAVRGYTDVLTLTEQLSPEGQQALSRVDSQAKRMGVLVEDLLQLARLDAQRPVPMVPLDLTEHVLEAVRDAQVAASEHTWRITVPEEPVEVLGNPAHVDQVLSNLLSNATKHTPAGTTVEARLEARGNTAVLTIADDGPGIPESFQPRLFDRFARADGARVATQGSTGLGLAIVKAIVEAMHGSISVHSAPGDTRFIVEIPLA